MKSNIGDILDNDNLFSTNQYSQMDSQSGLFDYLIFQWINLMFMSILGYDVPYYQKVLCYRGVLNEIIN